MLSDSSSEAFIDKSVSCNSTFKDESESCMVLDEEETTEVRVPSNALVSKK